jgi:hypothetical protein
MKLLLLAAAAIASSSAFAPLQPATRQQKAFQLEAASSLRPEGKRNDWDKPGYKKESTTPVPSPNALSKQELASMPEVMLDADYFLTIGVALLGPLIIWYHPCE